MSSVLSEMQNDILILRLNKPAQRNPMSVEVVEALTEALERQRRAQEARAIILTGEGTDFCAGGDITAFKELRHDVLRQMEQNINPLITLIRKVPVPIIAAVNGYAAGGGAGLALAADFMIASDTARIYFAFSKIGAVLDSGASYSLTRAVGPHRARQLAMLGGTIDAETAHEWGLAYKISKPGALLDDALELAAQLATGPSTALRLIKQQIDYAASMPLDQSLEFEALTQAQAFLDPELDKRVEAFLSG